MKNIEVIYDHVILVLLRCVASRSRRVEIVALLGGQRRRQEHDAEVDFDAARVRAGRRNQGLDRIPRRAHRPLTPGDLVGMGMVQVMEGRHCFGHLTVEENLITGAYTQPSRRRGAARRARAGLCLFSAPESAAIEPGGLRVGRRTADDGDRPRHDGRPSMLLLDEPSMGLAPQIVAEIFEIVRDLNQKEGVSILLAEQNTNVALKYADYGYILESGRIMVDGPAKALAENKDVKEFYLGMSSEGRKSFRDMKSYRRRKRWV